MPAGTIVGRRRYAGRIVKRELTNDRTPKQVITCAGLYNRLDQVNGSFTYTSYDIGSAISTALAQYVSDLPELHIVAANFPVIGLPYTGTNEHVSLLSVIANALGAVTSGDIWVVRVGHDYTPRLIRLYTSATDSYTYTIDIAQNTAAPFAVDQVKNVDQDATQMYNVVEVIGDTDPISKQPVRAIVYDSVDANFAPIAGSSMAIYGRIEATPVSNSACKTEASCAALGRALLNEHSLPAQSSSFKVYTRSFALLADPALAPPYGTPNGLQRGDCLMGVQNVKLTGFPTPAPTLYGLVATVLTTIQPGRDTFQAVQFADIEPDHNAALHTHGRRMATAIRQNTSPPAYLDQYTVAANALDYSAAGLTVTLPSFKAAFARPALATTTPITDVGGNTLTLTGNATNYVYLSAGNAWTVVPNDPTPVGASIFYGLFQTDNTHVIGFWPKCSVGLPGAAAAADSAAAAAVVAAAPTVAPAYPASPTVGQMCYRPDLAHLYIWDGSAWQQA
jgi:hypothetical protein